MVNCQCAKQGRRILLLPAPSLSPYIVSSGSLWLEAILSQQTPRNSWVCPHSWLVGPPCSSGWLAGNECTGSDNIYKNQDMIHPSHHNKYQTVFFDRKHMYLHWISKLIIDNGGYYFILGAHVTVLRDHSCGVQRPICGSGDWTQAGHMQGKHCTHKCLSNPKLSLI